MYEHDRLLALRVGAVDLLLFIGRENCHVILLWVCRLGQSVRCTHPILLFALISERLKTSWSFGNTSAIIYNKGINSDERS